MTATHHSILEVDRRGRLCDSAEQRSALLSLVAAELEVPSPSGTPMEIILPGGAKLAITSSGQIPIAAALIAEVFDNRFVCHLPYYRQAEIFARLGVKLDRKTFCDGSLLASDWLAILYTWLRTAAVSGLIRVTISKKSSPACPPCWPAKLSLSPPPTGSKPAAEKPDVPQSDCIAAIEPATMTATSPP